jgi:allophanate hydrolase
MTLPKHDLQIDSLLGDYAAGRRRPLDTLAQLHRDALETRNLNAWITLLGFDAIAAQVESVEARRAAGEVLPLYGVPFAIKDNIDLAGVPTTAACPSFARVPSESAPVVERLLRAGAIAVGKTNLDQFATGLVGTRSPYGACGSALDPEYISGGSSSGSALAVALGLVSFALGTDTAGSGRVPAALNNIVGLKPTRGLLSTRGVVPACRSLDCVSVFAGSVADAARVFDVAKALDPLDAFSREAPPGPAQLERGPFRFGVPEPLELFGDAASERAFARAIEQLTDLGGNRVRVDFAPFARAASLLYGGPWLAERQAAFGEFIAGGHADIDPVVGGILRGAPSYAAVDAFRGQYQLRELAQQTSAVWRDIDVLVVPTTPTTFTRQQIAEEPIAYNTRLGTYTNFTNLLDLCGVAVPAGFKAERLPFGITLLGPAFADRSLLALAARFHHSHAATVGATGVAVRVPGGAPSAIARALPRARQVPRVEQSIRLAVVGAHLRGQPLHRQLVELGARFELEGRTSAHYRLYALAGTVPPKPGLVRVSGAGAAIQLEVYSLDPAGFGDFVAQVPAPLAIGNVELESGEWVKGFVCEPLAVEGSVDITSAGGWRAYLAARG